MGPTWSQLGANLGPTWANLGQPGANMSQHGPTGHQRGANLEPTWDCMGQLGHLRANMDVAKPEKLAFRLDGSTIFTNCTFHHGNALEALRGRVGKPWGRPGEPFGQPWGRLGRPWGTPGRAMGDANGGQAKQGRSEAEPRPKRPPRGSPRRPQSPPSSRRPAEII